MSPGVRPYVDPLGACQVSQLRVSHWTVTEAPFSFETGPVCQFSQNFLARIGLELP